MTAEADRRSGARASHPGPARAGTGEQLTRAGPGGPGSGCQGEGKGNLIGSVAFGVSAVADHINPSAGQLHHAERSNLGTFIGALCFFAGALLLLPERTEVASDPVTTPAAGDT